MKRKGKFLVTLSLVLILVACSGKSSGTATNQASSSAASAPAAAPMEMRSEAYYPMAGEEKAVYDAAAGGGTLDSGGNMPPDMEVQQNKIIFTGNIYMETNSFDAVLDSIQGLMDDNGGYIESSNLYNYKQVQTVDYRAYNVTLKVPVERYKEIFSHLKTLGKLLSSDESANDVTGQYYDIESRLNTKKIEEERVLDMISRAIRIEDLIALEQRLGEIRVDIELYETKIRNLERLTSYSTINMTIHEIDEGEILSVSTDLGVRIQKSFAASVNGVVTFFENFIIFLASIIVPFAIISLAALVIFVFYKLYRFRKPKKEE